jgi:hypothetical protein
VFRVLIAEITLQQSLADRQECQKVQSNVCFDCGLAKIYFVLLIPKIIKNVPRFLPPKTKISENVATFVIYKKTHNPQKLKVLKSLPNFLVPKHLQLSKNLSVF